jgi:hypothetical protein
MRHRARARAHLPHDVAEAAVDPLEHADHLAEMAAELGLDARREVALGDARHRGDEDAPAHVGLDVERTHSVEREGHAGRDPHIRRRRRVAAHVEVEDREREQEKGP